MMVIKRKYNKCLFAFSLGTFVITVTLIGTFETLRGNSADFGEMTTKMEDLSIILRDSKRKVSQQRQRLKHLTSAFRVRNIDIEDIQNGGLKRHLMDTFQLGEKVLTPAMSNGKFDWFGSLLGERTWTSLNSSMLGCKDIENGRHVRFIGSGYTKSVEIAWVNGTKVALKRPAVDGKDMTHCVESGTPRKDCLLLSSYKILKEIALLEQLRHPSIIKLLGFCITEREDRQNEVARKNEGDRQRDGNRNVPSVSEITLITELGEPLDFLRLIQTPWEDRLRIMRDLASLLLYLKNSPLGPLIIHDFKPTQFVLVDGQLKLVDLDDVDVTLPSCSPTNRCVIRIDADNYRFIPCDESGRCPQFADKLNVFLAWQHFFSLQMYGGPAWLHDKVIAFLNKTKSAAVSSREALGLLDGLVMSYKAGHFNLSGNAPNYTYKVMLDTDLPGYHDYWCPSTRSPEVNNCVFSVASEEEAQYICAMDKECRAFVMTEDKTWTGRRLVYLKSGFRRPVRKLRCKLFIRVS